MGARPKLYELPIYIPGGSAPLRYGNCLFVLVVLFYIPRRRNPAINHRIRPRFKHIFLVELHALIYVSHFPERFPLDAVRAELCAERRIPSEDETNKLNQRVSD